MTRDGSEDVAEELSAFAESPPPPSKLDRVAPIVVLCVRHTEREREREKERDFLVWSNREKMIEN